jgi:guanylate kinase
VISRRIEHAKEEILAVGEYDFTIINDMVEEAAQEFIIVAKAARLKQSKEDEESFINAWLG